jgi:hypothetical protein
MKRKKRNTGGSLDSLLDTITTVVGILIILLIVVQLGADSAVKRIVEEKKEKNAEELMELAMEQFDDQKRALLKQKEELQIQKASQHKEQQKLIQEIAQLEKQLAAKKKEIPPAPSKLQNLRQQKSKLQKDKQTVEVKVKKIKGLLAKAPKPKGQTLSKEVNLPDPKPAIEGSSPYRFLCRNGKIFPLNENTLKRLVSSNLVKAGLKPNDNKEYDGKKFLAIINGKKLGTNFFTLMAREDKDKVIRFTIERKDEAGENSIKVVNSGSQYIKILAGLNPQKNYLLYEVFPDSFGVYLTARDFANKRKFPAGWKPAHRGTDWWSYDWGYRTLGRKEYLASRPKPKPNPNAGKPSPPRRPLNVLD